MRTAVLPLLGICLISLASCSAPDKHNPYKTWRDFGGSPDMSRFVDQDQITKENVHQLEEAWFYPTGDDRTYHFNPLIIDSVMYVLAKGNSLVALNAKTGEELWIHANLTGIARRGLNYWESKDGTDKRILFQMNSYLQAIDAETGKSILSFGDNGLVDLRQGIDRDIESITRIQSGTPGKVFEDMILLGSSPGESYLSSPGNIRAFNILTGELEWTFNTIPRPGEYGYDTWPPEAYKYVGGVNTWGEISIDVERGIAYFPLGSPTYDYYGADRKGSNLFGNSILAVDARTGERLWHYQMVHHDLWDYDPSSAPQLITVEHDGKKIDAVAVIPKHGFVFVFDRVTGEPLWPIEEREVPASDVPGEEAWPTQPFPTGPPPASRLTMTPEDVSTLFFTDEERKEWQNRIDTLQKGLFTPLSHKKGTLIIPGAVGGISYGNTGSNPDKGLMYVISIDWPSYYGPLRKVDVPEEAPVVEEKDEVPVDNSRTIYTQLCQACHGENRGGLIGPSLTKISERLNFVEFRQVMATGRGDMPAFPQFDEEAVANLYKYLSDNADVIVDPNQQDLPEGLVVAWGGAPGGQIVRSSGWWRRGAEPPYPSGVEAPDTRYYLQGWGLEASYSIKPPWSSIMAYDLNDGTLKWRRPLGEDIQALEEGISETGVIESQRNGMIVTSNGILFASSAGGKLYAYDADNGNILWEGELPTRSEGMPAMYEVDGKQYIVATATTPHKWARDTKNELTRPDSGFERGYVVFSLPEN